MLGSGEVRLLRRVLARIGKEGRCVEWLARRVAPSFGALCRVDVWNVKAWQGWRGWSRTASNGVDGLLGQAKARHVLMCQSEEWCGWHGKLERGSAWSAAAGMEPKI